MDTPTPIDSEAFGEQQCDMLFDMDTMGQITMVRFFNRELAGKLGYSEAELLGQHVTDFLIDSTSVAAAQHFGQLYAGETAFRAPSRKLKMKNGEMVTAESYLMPLYDPTGKLTGHRGMEFFTVEIMTPQT
jgi:PAS domain S-box-containing protein